MFHLFVPSEAEKKSDDWKKKNSDLIFLSRIQEPLEDTTEISNGEKINTYVFKIGDLVQYGDTVGRVVYDGGSEYKVKTSEGQKLTIQKEEIFLATENEQQVQIKKKMEILKAQIQEKENEIEKIEKLISIETVREQLQDAENAYQTTSWDRGNTLWNARKSVLTKLRKLLPDAPDGEIEDDSEYDENATVKVLLEFEVNELNKVTEDKRSAELSITLLQRQLTPQQEYLNSLEGVVTTQQQNKLLQDYEQAHPILWTWRKCYDLTFDKIDNNMKWEKSPSEVKKEKKLLNDYFQTTLSKNKRLYEQYNSGPRDEVNALFSKAVKRMTTKRMEIIGQTNAANDKVEFIINCLEHFAMFQFCELYQRKLREIKMLEKYTKIKTEKNN
tara:strand:- start:1209 stop:2366 length:1158 start_codon:yes stop_codon:yes gene_type:complete